MVTRECNQKMRAIRLLRQLEAELLILRHLLFHLMLKLAGPPLMVALVVGLLIAIVGIVLLGSAEEPPNTRLASADVVPSPAPTT